jgi:hypothetical protein
MGNVGTNPIFLCVKRDIQRGLGLLLLKCTLEQAADRVFMLRISRN